MHTKTRLLFSKSRIQIQSRQTGRPSQANPYSIGLLLRYAAGSATLRRQQQNSKLPKPVQPLHLSVVLSATRQTIKPHAALSECLIATAKPRERTPLANRSVVCLLIQRPQHGQQVAAIAPLTLCTWAVHGLSVFFRGQSGLHRADAVITASA